MVTSTVTSVVAAVAAALRRTSGVAFVDAAGGRRCLLLDGRALNRYLEEGGPTGVLGGPISERRPATPGPETPFGAAEEVTFVRGTIYLDRAGHTKVVLTGGECL